MQSCSAVLVFISAFYCSAELDYNGEDDFPLVHTSYGPVQGIKIASSWTNKSMYAFRGIPYASPPVHGLRFKAPVPPAKWATTKDCTQDQPECLQPHWWSTSISPMSEDCLYLNVYTPKLKPNTLLPVMVWVHGGAFMQGSGGHFQYGPDALVGEDIIFVSLNYRLGALGFLTLDTANTPGNMGLRDQWLALKWVQQNIHEFGGDPARVTLFGESAGSASVHLHYLSPLSKGLFSRVIGESGTALAEWTVRDNGRYYGLQLAAALGCSTLDIASAEKCLMAADAHQILDAQSKVQPTLEDSTSGRSLVFIPTIDRNTSDKPFLPDFPKNLLRDGKGSYVPFVMGINSDEGMMVLGGTSKEAIKNATNNLESFISLEVRKNSSRTQIDKFVKKIKEFYFKTPPSERNLKGYIDINTDFMFGYATAVSARAFRERGPVYLYYFSFNGMFKEKQVKNVEEKYNISGVSHAEDLNYIFVNQYVNQTRKDADEMMTWKRVVRMWTNFAKYGAPTVGPDSDLGNVTWLPVGNSTTNYLSIDKNLSMVREDFLRNRVALWDSITPSSSGSLTSAGVIAVAVACLVTFM